jgi:hypothetical protein
MFNKYVVLSEVPLSLYFDMALQYSTSDSYKENRQETSLWIDTQELEAPKQPW